MFYWSNILNRKSFSGELSQYLTWNFGVESQNLAIFDPFYASKFKSDQKINNTQWLHRKNLYPVEWAKLSSTSVVILIVILLPWNSAKQSPLDGFPTGVVHPSSVDISSSAIAEYPSKLKIHCSVSDKSIRPTLYVLIPIPVNWPRSTHCVGLALA